MGQEQTAGTTDVAYVDLSQGLCSRLVRVPLRHEDYAKSSLFPRAAGTGPAASCGGDDTQLMAALVIAERMPYLDQETLRRVVGHPRSNGSMVMGDSIQRSIRTQGPSWQTVGLSWWENPPGNLAHGSLSFELTSAAARFLDVRTGRTIQSWELCRRRYAGNCLRDPGMLAVLQPMRIECCSA